jgi:hypothetical protein
MNEPDVVIEWTVSKLKRFKKAYKAATKLGVDSFEFEDNIFVTNYAKYLIEYLAQRFGE